MGKPFLRLVVVSLGCMVGLSAFANLSQRSARGPDPGRRRAFIHADHVPWVWAQGVGRETKRDCRGCHVFDANGGRDPQAVCHECHLATSENESSFRPSFAEGWETLDGYRDPETAFRHHTHEALACRECHGVEGPLPSDPMPIRRGSAMCTRCHGPADGDDPLEFEVLLGESKRIRETVQRSLLDELNGSPNMQPHSLGPFFHSEHLEDPEASFGLQALLDPVANQGVCTSCHEPLLGADGSALHGERFKQDACGECHTGQDGPLTFGSTLAPGTSLAALTFSHADHLVFASEGRDPDRASYSGYDRIEGEGCHACHEYEPDQRTFMATDVASHEGCRTCHSSSSWEATQHGEWSEWGCVDCHTFESAGQLAFDRPEASVRRRRSGRFVIESQVHPHIAGSDATKTFEGNCSQCHRARVDELPSRLGTRAFSHATHLPPDAEAQHCAACHGARVSLADSSGTISDSVGGARIAATDAVFSPMLGSTYDMRACTACHRGGVREAVEIEFEAIEPTRVAEFSHAQHLGKMGPRGAVLDCLTCHQVPDQAGAAMVTLPAANACTQCHDHRPGPNSESSGRALSHEIDRCSKCHVETIPAAGGLFDVQRSHLASLIGPAGQFHPDDRECTECHLVQSPGLAESAILEDDHVFAEGGRAREGLVLRKHQHRAGDDPKGFLQGEGVGCGWCHWTQGVEGSFDFESVEYRSDFGNLMQAERGGSTVSYPGGGFRAQFGGL